MSQTRVTKNSSYQTRVEFQAKSILIESSSNKFDLTHFQLYLLCWSTLYIWS